MYMKACVVTIDAPQMKLDFTLSPTYKEEGNILFCPLTI